MAKRKKRAPGRKVYQTWSKEHSPLTRADAVREYANRARVLSPENIRQRQRRENATTERVAKLFNLDVIDPQAFDDRGSARAEVAKQLDSFVKLENMDKHLVIHRGLRTVLILFFEGKGRKSWFVERNLLTGKLRKSIVYGEVSQALMYHKTGTIKFVE